jgi:hypothetical protein
VGALLAELGEERERVEGVAVPAAADPHDAAEHPSDSEVSIHTTDEPGGVLASFPMRGAGLAPAPR